jgi:esterase/lipase
MGISNFKKWNIILTKKFFQDGNKNLVLKNNFSFNKPVILIHGLEDKDVLPEISQKIMKKTSSNIVQIRYLKNSGHRLSTKNDLKTILNAIDNILELIKQT